MNCILFEHDEVHQNRVTLRDHRADHICSILKCEAGQTVRVGMLDGAKGVGDVYALNENSVELHLNLDDTVASRPKVNLLLALPRPKIMKRLWAPIASLGVDQIVLMNAEKVERNYWASHTLNESYYRPLLIEGLQQCGDTHVPQVRCVKAFRPFVEDEVPTLCADANCLLADEESDRRLSDLPSLSSETTWVAIGPEGGWNRFEVELLHQQGFVSFSLGERILRSDVACISILAVLNQFGNR